MSESEPSHDAQITEITFALEQHQSRFFIIAVAYFVSLYVGMMQLGTVVSYLGVGLFVFVLMLWIICPTLVFLLITRRYCQPLRDISDWLDKYLGEE